MIFSDIYPRSVAEMILDGTKCQTRRLVKESEGFVLTTDKKSLKEYNEGREISNPNPKTWNEVWTAKGRIKWQVGRDYAVQLGRGKPVEWYCYQGNKIEKAVAESQRKSKSLTIIDCGKEKLHYMKPLRIKITGIRKESLCDFYEKDRVDELKKEGFDSWQDYFKAIIKVILPSMPNDFISQFPSENKSYLTKQVMKEWLNAPLGNMPIPMWNPKVWVLSFEVK